jgi:4-amino-4-deoxy-L-arabinose transferase-like glycosyltransferase
VVWATSAAALGGALLFGDYGMGWDSEVQAAYGERVLDYFLSGFKDLRAVTDGGLLPYYGAIFELPSAALHRLLGADKHAFRGLLTALCATATLPAVAGIARRTGGERMAFWSVACLVLTPQFFGHAFINSKDVPLALAVSWAVLAICRLAMSHRVGWRDTLLVGAACGTVLAVRVGAIFIMLFLLAALAARWALGPWLPEEGRPGFSRAELARAGLQGVAGLMLAWAVTVAAWPFAHQNPVLNPYAALRGAAAFPVSYPVLFAGSTLESSALPRTYLPVYFALTLSPPLLAFLAIGTVAAGRALARRRDPGSIATAVVLFWMAFPLLYVVSRRPNIYDGVRHFLFLLPAMAILAGWGVEAATGAIERRLGRAPAAAFLLAALAAAAAPLVRYHPYQYAYLNALAGERATLHERYETDYWVTSYRAAAEWLNERQAESPEPLRVIAAVNDHSFPCLLHFLDRRILWAPLGALSDHTTLPPDADYYVGTVRLGTHRLFPSAPVVWAERRDGVLFSVIRANPDR